MSTNPAETFGLNGKGTLAPGTDADIVLFDPEEPTRITAADNASKQDFTLYEDWEVRGAVVRTYVRGQEVAREGEIVGGANHGEFIERSIPDWSI